MVRSGGEVGESACSGQFMRATLDPEEASRLLIEGYGRMARAYDANVGPYHAPIARRLLELGRVGAEERVLDIGCGTGIAAFEAAATVDERGSILGIDLAEPAVRLAAERAAATNLPQLRFDVMDSRVLRLRRSPSTSSCRASGTRSWVEIAASRRCVACWAPAAASSSPHGTRRNLPGYRSVRFSNVAVRGSWLRTSPA